MKPAELFADIYSDDHFNAHAYRSAGHRVIAIKATEGAGYVNPHHAAWVDAAHAAGLAVVHYHFCRPENGNAGGQGAHFWNAVRPRYHRGDRLAFDLETGNPRTAGAWLREADAMVCQLNGGAPPDRPVGYTYLSYFNEAGGTLSLRSHAWWMAAWGALLRLRTRLAGGQYLWAQQFTDGHFGPEPHRFAGVIGTGAGGTGDGSVINKRSLYLIDRAKKGHH